MTTPAEMPAVAVSLELETGPSVGVAVRAYNFAIRLKPGPDGVVGHRCVLVHVEGEREPRWIDATRVRARTPVDAAPLTALMRRAW